MAAPAPVSQAVLALGRLMPAGDVVTLAPPYGASDARIARLLVAEGDRVAAGAVIAELDSLPQLEALRDSAAATVRARAAALAQTRVEITSGAAQARAARDAAAAARDLARSELDRIAGLARRGVATPAQLDAARTAATEADRAHDRAEAALSRYAGLETGEQADILLAESNLAVARADLARARVVAPGPGQVLQLLARPGEKPGTAGVATFGDTRAMQAEIEVYQTDVARLAPGQAVRLSAPALGPAPLDGQVIRIGLQVGRQSLVAEEPAAHTDARVVKVVVALTPEASTRAAGFTGLEVVARILVAGEGA
ncbi:HlyD family efflux transporter periplasmic adaptor subunit [Phaeovulum vinaykumarii]|uniref:HlyD family secretion protein n=1 Tax=Phaeovulum vinaykumarii TaxID=407234 RepID=A0A1N7L1S7_9RHOB|nr:HlyD family efflux transporter periplasmic adaptor subunit [Phaeovulum vinaykumarii]SIS67799.1 HlyD family secretion protein [Phaeovulum vinaykumarii]SOC00545.1 HlyD family secretion protein [Phaeovulum vinaykumarii]